MLEAALHPSAQIGYLSVWAGGALYSAEITESPVVAGARTGSAGMPSDANQLGGLGKAMLVAFVVIMFLVHD